MSQAPLATSVPVIPIAKPTSALVKAGASLVPSPVTATTPSESWTPVTRILLSSGEDLARTLRCLLIYLNLCMFLTYSTYFPGIVAWSTNSSPPTAVLKSFPVMQEYSLDSSEASISSWVTIPALIEMVAVSMLSPVHIIVLIPAVLVYLIEATIVDLSGSWRPKIP